MMGCYDPMMYVFTTIPYPHGHWQLQELLWNPINTIIDDKINTPRGGPTEISAESKSLDDAASWWTGSKTCSETARSPQNYVFVFGIMSRKVYNNHVIIHCLFLMFHSLSMTQHHDEPVWRCESKRNHATSVLPAKHRQVPVVSFLL